MNESAFLGAIAAEPDDMSHRLVFADWLEDRGDAPSRARAAFIRAQIARAELPAYHPRARALLREERVPFNAHGAAWYSAVLPHCGSHRFHRGFVEQVRVGAEQLLHDGERLFAAAPVRHLQLRGSLGIPALLSNDPANARRLGALLARVRKLDLNRDYLGEAAGAALLGLPQPPRLAALALSHNALTPSGVAVLADSPLLETLESLEFTASASAADGVARLLHSPRLKRLRSLSLAGARLGDRVARVLATSKLFCQLRSLSLSHNGLTAAGLRALGEARGAELESLDVGFNPLGPEGVQAVEHAPAFRSLRELSLSRTEQGDEGARAVAAGTLPSRLASLDLSLNHIGEAGAQALARFAGPSRLLSLDLIYNALGRSAGAVARRFGDEVCSFDR